MKLHVISNPEQATAALAGMRNETVSYQTSAGAFIGILRMKKGIGFFVANKYKEEKTVIDVKAVSMIVYRENAKQTITILSTL